MVPGSKRKNSKRRQHGFLSRMRRPGGRRVIKARRAKGRHKLTVN